MSCRTQVSQSFSSIILFLKLFKTYEIGQLANICSNLNKDPTIYDNKTFSRLLIHFITHVSEENRKNHTEQQHIAVIITQSLIYNLFMGNSKNQLNNSIYSNSLMNSSNSHIAFSQQSNLNIKNYQSIDEQLSKKFFNFIQDFITDNEIQKKFKLMIDRGAIKSNEQGYNQNQRYIDILFETIEYIVKKNSKIQKNYQFDNFQMAIINKNIQSINSHYQKKNFKILIGQVNKIIFSNKLNRIAFVLSQADQKLYYSLLRIYFGELSEEDIRRGKSAKYYAHLDYNGQQMIFNLIFAYIQSIPNKNELFQPSKNPLFRLIESYLLCFYLPTFRNFNQIIAKCCKYDFTSGIQFYKVCENTINNNLSQFIQSLPNDLIDYLRKIYKIILISDHKSTKKQPINNSSSIALMAVKKLLIYSLLVRPLLIQSYYSQGVDLQKYQEVCNNLINLFFKSSLKKFQNLDSEEFEIANELTKSISNKLESKIVGALQLHIPSEQAVNLEQFYQDSVGVKNYIIEQPMLNNDYQTLWDKIKNIEFTPKDLKEFQMRKKAQLSGLLDTNHIVPSMANISSQTPILNLFSPRQAIQSPMHKTKKDAMDYNNIQNVEYPSQRKISQIDVNQKQQIDFLTWMTIGGTKNYDESWNSENYDGNKPRSQKKIRTGFNIETFPKDKIREINKLYQKYQSLIL